MTTTTTNTTAKKLSPEELLAKFNLDVHDRAFQMQKLRSGLLSSPDAVRAAVFEQFSNSFIGLKNAIDFTKLLGGESKEEQIQAMKEFVSSSSGSTKEASDIVQNMLDKFSTEHQIRNRPSIAPAPTPNTPEHKDYSKKSGCSQSDNMPQNDASTATNNKTDDEGSCCTAP